MPDAAGLQPLRFKHAESARCYFAVDMACHILEGFANQFANTNQPGLSTEFSKLAEQAAKLRDGVQEQDAQRVVLASAVPH